MVRRTFDREELSANPMIEAEGVSKRFGETHRTVW